VAVQGRSSAAVQNHATKELLEIYEATDDIHEQAVLLRVKLLPALPANTLKLLLVAVENVAELPNGRGKSTINPTRIAKVTI
jgi:hypothetical protein